MDTLGKRIKKARENAGLMQSQLASDIGVILGSCIAGAACVEKYYNAKVFFGAFSLKQVQAA